MWETDETRVTSTYGPISSWDVSSVTSLAGGKQTVSGARRPQQHYTFFPRAIKEVSILKQIGAISFVTITRGALSVGSSGKKSK